MTDFNGYRCRKKLNLCQYAYNLSLFNIVKLDSVNSFKKKIEKKVTLTLNFFHVDPAV